MPIEYLLLENNIIADGDDLVQDIIDQGSTVNKPDILAVTAALKLACQRRVEQASLNRLCGVMSPEETVSRLKSTPASYLESAVAPKLGVGVDLNRRRDRVGCLLGPNTVLTRFRPHRDEDPTLPRFGLGLTAMGARLQADGAHTVWERTDVVAHGKLLQTGFLAIRTD